MSMELYVAACRDLPLQFNGPICVRLKEGGDKKVAWISGAANFDKYCAWDYRNPSHVVEIGGKSSLVLEVVTGTKDERCAGVVFVKEGQHEGWHKLVPGGNSPPQVMGLIYVRVGPKLSQLVEPVTEALNLDEAFPHYETESQIRMEPPPPESMSLGRVFSLAVSLADVFRVRQFLVNGGSSKTQVIIGRGINGTPLEAICANCPGSFTRKKMRIEFEGASYSRMRSADDAVAIVELLLLAGAKHDARSVRWLYDNATASQGKQALMKVLDKKLYGEAKKKKTKKSAASPAAVASAAAPSEEGWAGASARRQASSPGLLLGGQRGRRGPKSASATLTPEEEEKQKYEEAQKALSRPIKPIPLIPDDADEKREDDSDDLEEESSEHDDEPVSRPVPANLPPPPSQKKPVPSTPVDDDIQNVEEPVPDEPFDAIENVMSEIEFAHEQQQREQQQESQQQQDEEIVEVSLPLDLEENKDDRAALNDSVLDWEGVQTEYDFEVGEEVSEVAMRALEKQWKRPPSVLFKIIKK